MREQSEEYVRDANRQKIERDTATWLAGGNKIEVVLQGKTGDRMVMYNSNAVGGSKSRKYNLTGRDVAYIFNASHLNPAMVARMFNIPHSVVHNIRARKTHREFTENLR